MRRLFLDPLSSKTSWQSIFDDDSVVEERICNAELAQYDELLCFDAFKTFNFLKNTPFCYDLMALYELMGYKFENFEELSKKVLGEDKTGRYSQLLKTANAHMRSFQFANYTLSKYSVSDFIPKDVFQSLYHEKAHLSVELYKNITDKGLKTFYQLFFAPLVQLHNLGKQPIYVDLELLATEKNYFFDLMKKNLYENAIYLDFHPVGAKTGRISFKKGSPNLYILPKELRRVLVAPPDYKIIQADFKSFQPRIAIFSTNDEEFKTKFADIDDVYSVFPGDREENKISFISWMFSNQRNKKFEEFAGAIKKFRNELYHQAINNGKVINKFGRPLYYHEEEDHVVFQNYITSIEADAILELTCYIANYLKDKRSRIIFPFHDSLVFYIHKDEEDQIAIIKEIMENYHRKTFNSRLPVTIKSGPNFLEIS